MRGGFWGYGGCGSGLGLVLRLMLRLGAGVRCGGGIIGRDVLFGHPVGLGVEFLGEEMGGQFDIDEFGVLDLEVGGGAGFYG